VSVIHGGDDALQLLLKLDYDTDSLSILLQLPSKLYLARLIVANALRFSLIA